MTCEELRRLLDESGAACTPDALAHLAACADCARLARRWAEAQGALRVMGREPAPPFLHARIMAHVRAAESTASPRRSFLHGWRASALAAVGAAVVIVGLGLYRAVRPLSGPEPTRPAVLAEVRPQATDEKVALEMKVAAPAPAAAPVDGLKDELSRSKEQETDKGRRAKGDDAGATSRVAVGNVTSLPEPTQAPAPAPTTPARVGGPRDLTVATTAREEQVAAAQAPAAGFLQAVAPSAQASGLVRCRLRLEGNHQDLEVDLPQAEAPTPDQVWLVTVHPDGRIELRDTQGLDKQAPLALQQGLTQQQARTGRYRLSQAPLR
ncbi:MAG: hypothetical protein MUF10_02180 [Thermoanaerobaculaceae bacterium]|jgi:hypothetical protein|nr:hypothetical protein [Thermoanaerobaculaceae bacterium]